MKRSRCPQDFNYNAKQRRRSFLRRIVLVSDLVDKPVPVPWWNRLPMRLTIYNRPATQAKLS